MNASQAYDKYIIKTEKNSVNDNIATDRGRFVIIYNEYQNRFIEYIYEKKNEDDFRYIQLLLEEVPITSSTKQDNFYLFKLPKNYFEFSSVSAKGSKGNCSNQSIDLFEIKDLNRTVELSDEYTSPNFEYREAPLILSSNNIKIFTTDFSIERLNLSYYRYPKQLKLLNPKNPESPFDDSFQLDFDDKVIDRIISATAGGFDQNNNSDRWQVHNMNSKLEL